ncbi:MAG TPA: MBL fold metallo-hydrolase [Streptosporangiaceae bacterium]
MTGRLTLTWYGQAGFRLDGGHSRVLVDPFLADRDDRRYPPVAGAADFADITVVLCTHEHIDHLDLKFLPGFCAVNAAAKIVVPAPVTEVAAAGGVAQDRLIGAVQGQEIKDRDVVVRPLPALHGMDDPGPAVYEFGDGRFLGYVIDVGGVRVFHFGDGLLYPELIPALRELAPEVMLLPINGRDFMREQRGLVGNMNEDEAAWLCDQIRPAYIIPMHYEMFAGNRGDVGRFASRVHEYAADGGPVLVMPSRGRPFTLEI